jgi:hypothetical protein
MAVGSFTDVFMRLESFGLTDALLPFLLIFAIVFAVLDRVQIFHRKQVNLVIALVLASLVVIPHITGTYPPGMDAVEIINTSIPNVTIFMIAIVMVLILIGVFGVNVNIGDSPLGGFVMLMAFLVVGLIFANSAGWLGGKAGVPSWLGFLGDPDIQALVLVLLVFGIIVFFITSEEGSGPSMGDGIQNFLGALGKSVKPPK